MESAPADPDFPGLAPPAEPPAVDGFDEATASLAPAEQARLAARRSRRPAAARLYGYVTSGVVELAVATSTGLGAEQRMTDATSLVLAADEGASGYAERPSWRVGDVDPAATAAEAVGEGGARRAAAASSSRAATAPCSSRTRSPSCSSTSRTTASAALGLLEESSYFAGRIGERVFAPKISIAEDALDPRGLPKALDFEGTPKRRVPLVEDGVARGVVWDRATAARGGRASRPATRCRRVPPLRAGAVALSVAGGEAESVDELAEAVGDGIYITRLHYLGVVSPREGIVTGMTRDGTFRIRDGKRRRAARQPALHRRRAGRCSPTSRADACGSLVNAASATASATRGYLVPAIATGRFTITRQRLGARDLARFTRA